MLKDYRLAKKKQTNKVGPPGSLAWSGTVCSLLAVLFDAVLYNVTWGTHKLSILLFELPDPRLRK